MQVFPDRYNQPPGNTSPIVLERFYHQQRQSSQSPPMTHPILNSDLIACNMAAVSANAANEKEGAVKRRFASCIKVQLSGHQRQAPLPLPMPLPAAPNLMGSLDRRRHQSPDPPPRLNRGASDVPGSPLAARRDFLERLNSSPGSPGLPRRYPSAPHPPPRRLSESSSQPGSPQHLRTRLHFTPEPLRRHYPPPELS